MDLPQKTRQSEEVDLGQLFNLIGKAFDRFFNFVGKVFVKIFDLFLLLLIHFFKRLKWYVLAIVLGLFIGYFIDKSAPYLYSASMQIQTNYGSSKQVYENINYLNQLAGIDKDSIELAKRLKIDVSKAASIRGFSISPNIDENDKMKLFSDFRAELDSLTKSTFTYNDYLDGLTSYSFRTHQIEVISVDKFIFPELNSSLLDELSTNTFLNELRDTEISNINKEQAVLERQKSLLDSLNNFYLTIRKNESEKGYKKSGDGTNFFLGEVQEKNLVVDETKISERILALDREIIDLSLDVVERKYIVNAISLFPAAGYNISNWTEKAKVRVPIVFALILLSFFLLLGLKKYLDKEEKRIFEVK
ncbi:copper transporter family protein [Hyunsoonleella flava]|uniref:Copper transporter family protein n=2 Tax=Hyunsoonleella flava TaxID=2527939 RepID=A0A4Q9FFV7_9FLAO|nr:copper transporter family protein [Hyunsoonleella flava]